MGLAGNRIGASRRRFGTSVLVRSDDMAGGGLGKPGWGNPTTVRASAPARFLRALRWKQGVRLCSHAGHRQRCTGEGCGASAMLRHRGARGKPRARLRDPGSSRRPRKRLKRRPEGSRATVLLASQVRFGGSVVWRGPASVGTRTGCERFRPSRVASRNGGESPELERSPRKHRADQSWQRGWRATDFWRGNP
jgi:hypothetical protein